MGISTFLTSPWPWYIAGPLIGLTVPVLLLVGNKSFGVSANLRHVCAMIPNKHPFFNYDWRKTGGWNLIFALGILLGGILGGVLLKNPEPLQLAASTQADLQELGIAHDGSLAPQSLFSLESLFSFKGFLVLLGGGFLVGFGARYAGGCTSGHAISGLANLQLPSLVAVIGFFAGGLAMTHLLFPLIFR
ncbi:MAG: YeeE/YedE family protein [Trueperaceae bacterium]|nr:YeeE/YedE family protein [Trueperaceae bacterium]